MQGSVMVSLNYKHGLCVVNAKGVAVSFVSPAFISPIISIV